MWSANRCECLTFLLVALNPRKSLNIRSYSHAKSGPSRHHLQLVTALPMGKRSTILLGPSFYGDVSITNELTQAFPLTHHVGAKFGRRHRPWRVTDRFHALREIGRVHYACD